MADSEGYSREFYDKYVELEESPIFQQMIRPTVLQALSMTTLENKSVYEMGCGTGFFMRFALLLQPRLYVGMDLSADFFHILGDVARDLTASTQVKFIQGDNTVPITFPEYGSFDLVFSSYALYATSYQQLLGYALHAFHALTNSSDSFALINVYHADAPRTKEVVEQLYSFNHTLHPKIPEGDSYPPYTKIQIDVTPPILPQPLFFETEYVVGRQEFLRAFQEAGFVKIETVVNIVTPGHEKLLEFADVWGLTAYKCYKSA